MTLLYFILILGVIVLIHEFGHFIFAKKAGIYVYEFSIGMGPRIFKWTRKNDETEYSIRLIPIGGFVQMAGEDFRLLRCLRGTVRYRNLYTGQRYRLRGTDFL